MALLLKHGRDANFELEIDAYRAIFQACIAAVGDEYIFTMLNYAAELSDGVAGEKIFHFLEQVLINKTDLIMTYGQQLRQGAVQRDRLAIAKTRLTTGYDPHEVKALTGISQEAINKIKPTKKQS